MNEIQTILESLKDLQITDLKVYIITRHLKQDIVKSRKMLDKWDFDLHRIEIDNDVSTVSLSLSDFDHLSARLIFFKHEDLIVRPGKRVNLVRRRFVVSPHDVPRRGGVERRCASRP